MTFKRWFKRWIRSFVAILTHRTKHHKTEYQRERERERRLNKRLHSGAFDDFKAHKERKKPRTQNGILTDKVMDFIACSFAVLLLFPFGLFDFAIKRHHSKKAKKKRLQTSNNPYKAHTHKVKTTLKKDTSIQHTSENHSAASTDITEESAKIPCPVADLHSDNTKEPEEPISIASESSEVRADSVEKSSDAKATKSTPRYAKDKNIRKTMRFSFCEADGMTFAELHTGMTFDIDIARIDSTDRIILSHLGKSLGYAASEDESVLSTCLSLGDKLYGIITDTDPDSNTVCYEAWIDKRR